MTSDGFPVLARLYLVSNRLYQMVVVFPKDRVDAKSFERMAGSLRLNR